MSTAYLAIAALTAMVAVSSPAWAQITPTINQDLTTALDGSRALNGFSTRCVTYALETETPIYMDIDVRAVHGGGCGGDPGAAPKMMTLRYDKRSSRVYKRDDATGDFTMLR